MFFVSTLLILLCYNYGLSEPTEQKCPDNEYWSDCANSDCRAKICDDIGFRLPCPQVLYCTEKCVCNEGYVRIKYNDVCIPEEQCQICKRDKNAVKGDGRHCDNLCSNYNKKDGRCIQSWNDTEFGCKCKEGFVYDETTYKCVYPNECRLQN